MFMRTTRPVATRTPTRLPPRFGSCRRLMGAPPTPSRCAPATDDVDADTTRASIDGHGCERPRRQRGGWSRTPLLAPSMARIVRRPDRSSSRTTPCIAQRLCDPRRTRDETGAHSEDVRSSEMSGFEAICKPNWLLAKCSPCCNVPLCVARRGATTPARDVCDLCDGDDSAWPVRSWCGCVSEIQTDDCAGV